jgi:hypothetical protein
MAVYIPIGHGYENLKVKRGVVPDGCSLTVIETPGGLHHMTNFDSDGFFEYNRVKKYFESNPPNINPETGKIESIFSNPKQNAKEIIDVFGSVAIFGPGEKHPNIEYNLNLLWYERAISAHDVRYSGLIPLENFLKDEFSSKNILDKLLTNTSEPAMIGVKGKKAAFIPLNDNENAILHNKKEQYKFSIYPSLNDIEGFWSSKEQKIQKLEDNNFHDLALLLKSGEDNGDSTAFSKSIELFEGSEDKPLELQEDITNNLPRPLKQEGFINITLKTLMHLFPGNYIHISCRETDQSSLQSPEETHTKEEVFTKRIPLMSGNQKRQAIANIEQSKRNKVKSRFNIHSTKNTRNIMLAALRRSLAQNQIKNTNHPIILKNPSETERPNETLKKQVEYTGKKWATVTTGGRTRRNKLYKYKSRRNRR